MDKLLWIAVLLCQHVTMAVAGWAPVNAPAGSVLADLETEGQWTGPLNFDSSNGFGDYEIVSKWLTEYNKVPQFAGTCPLWCEDPLAVKWEVKPQSYYQNTTEEIEQCATLFPEKFYHTKPSGQPNGMKGFYCINSNQKMGGCSNDFCITNRLSTYLSKRESVECDKCPDFVVDYLCPNTVPKPDGDCPKDFEREMADLDYKMLLNDKAMAEVKVAAERELAKKEQAEMVEQKRADHVDEEYRELEEKLLAFLNLKKQQ